jgi:hypothetical protein
MATGGTSGCFVRVSSHFSKPAVEIGNAKVGLKVACSGCQIVCASAPGVPFNPLWDPPWETVPVSLRRVKAREEANFSQAKTDVMESQLLASIGGHSYCLDVFGAHSEGETKHSGLSFHGEAGLKEWEVTDVTDNSVTLSCHLKETQLAVSREFTVHADLPVIQVSETLKNLVGFQRALGRQQHVTIGSEMLKGDACTFTTNCDKGRTWPDDNGENSFFATGKDFEVGENIPRKDGGTDDWSRYPRCESNSDLCTMRVAPSSDLGYFSVLKPGAESASGSTVSFSYTWERETFPWLMTWEENRCRSQAPWKGRTLCRGLEFGSYCFATGRKRNVEQGSMFGTPCFEWVDAYEEKKTNFWISLQTGQFDATNPLKTGVLAMEQASNAFSSSN